jgi:hypothetical protein
MPLGDLGQRRLVARQPAGGERVPWDERDAGRGAGIDQGVRPNGR